MTAEVFAEWLRGIGHRVVRTPNSYWFERVPRVYQSFPYFSLITPTVEELEALLRDHRAVGARFSAPASFPWGACSYHTLTQDRSYGLEAFSKKNRNKLRQIDGIVDVAPIPIERYADEGWVLYTETLKRQGRRREMSRIAWVRRCAIAAGLPGFEAWGATVNGVLAAEVFGFSCDDCFYILAQYSRNEYLRLSVNAALVYRLTQAQLRKPGIQTVHYGVQSLDALPSVDEFKFRCGFVMHPVKQCVYLRRTLSRLPLNPLLVLLRALPGPLSGFELLAKSKGILRMHLQGQLPADEQDLLPRLKTMMSHESSHDS